MKWFVPWGVCVVSLVLLGTPGCDDKKDPLGPFPTQPPVSGTPTPYSTPYDGTLFVTVTAEPETVTSYGIVKVDVKRAGGVPASGVVVKFVLAGDGRLAPFEDPEGDSGYVYSTPTNGGGFAGATFVPVRKEEETRALVTVFVGDRDMGTKEFRVAPNQ